MRSVSHLSSIFSVSLGRGRGGREEFGGDGAGGFVVAGGRGGGGRGQGAVISASLYVACSVVVD